MSCIHLMSTVLDFSLPLEHMEISPATQFILLLKKENVFRELRLFYSSLSIFPSKLLQFRHLSPHIFCWFCVVLKLSRPAFLRLVTSVRYLVEQNQPFVFLFIYCFLMIYLDKRKKAAQLCLSQMKALVSYWSKAQISCHPNNNVCPTHYMFVQLKLKHNYLTLPLPFPPPAPLKFPPSNSLHVSPSLKLIASFPVIIIVIHTHMYMCVQMLFVCVWFQGRPLCIEQTRRWLIPRRG